MRVSVSVFVCVCLCMLFLTVCVSTRTAGHPAVLNILLKCIWRLWQKRRTCIDGKWRSHRRRCCWEEGDRAAYVFFKSLASLIKPGAAWISHGAYDDSPSWEGEDGRDERRQERKEKRKIGEQAPPSSGPAPGRDHIVTMMAKLCPWPKERQTDGRTGRQTDRQISHKKTETRRQTNRHTFAKTLQQ